MIKTREKLVKKLKIAEADKAYYQVSQAKAEKAWVKAKKALRQFDEE